MNRGSHAVRWDRPTLASLFLLTMAVLMMELCLTRSLSVVSWQDFVYLMISLALLGFGAAGSYLTVSKRFANSPQESASQLGHFAWLFSLSAAVAIILVSKIRFYPEDIIAMHDYSNGVSLLILYFILGVPFFFAGVCIGRLVAMAGDQVNVFYFVDLAGAGVGALLALPVVSTVGGVAGIFLAASMGALAACILGAGGVRWRRAAYPLTLAVMLVMTIVVWKTNLIPLYCTPSKDLFRKELDMEYTRWHVVARVDMARPEAQYPDFGGALAGRARTKYDRLNVMAIYQDGAAPTGMVMIDRKPEEYPILGEYLQGAAYTVGPARDALVIGFGGGVDTLIAMHYGLQNVVGVDINPRTIEAVSKVFRDRSPGMWDGRLKLHIAEGRHYLTRTGEKFDVIQLSGVDTFTALSSGAYAMAEVFLYTKEAMRDYWDHLTPGGTLSFSRWLFHPPRETLRLINTELAMLAEQGVTEPWKHIILVCGPAKSSTPWAETLLRKTPFTPEEVQALGEWAREREFSVLYDPYHAPSDDQRPASETPTRPVREFGISPDAIFNRFIRADVPQRQELISGYVYNVKPTTDDDPFFFQYYRWKSVLDMIRGRNVVTSSTGGYGITRFPLGFIVLTLSLVQILLLSLVLILVPLWMRNRITTGQPGRMGVFLYFAALGLGFMFIEIALLQKLSVFVGGPMYSMAITLASILIYSGLGSYVGRSFEKNPGRCLAVVIGTIVTVICGEIYFLNRILPALMGLRLEVRWVVASIAVFPVAFLLGMPLPTGLRILQQIDPAVRPWAWGINAFATVIGGIACVLLSIEKGFTVTLLVAAVLYVLGGLALGWSVRRSRFAVRAA